MWKNDGNFNGSKDCYIFSFLPKFKNFFPIKTENMKKNFTYLNDGENSENELGLGKFNIFKKKKFF